MTPPAFELTPSVALLTMSFRGDLELCQLLCETIDALIPSEFPHILAVPRADIPLFASLANRRRHLIEQESLLPSWMWKLPLPGSSLRQLLRLPRRNIYIAQHRRLVRGWIAQQMMKLAATSQSGADVVLHVDSDVAFVRTLKREHLFREGKVRLLRTTGAGDTPMHHPWHEAASKLLGLSRSSYHGADYIGNLTTWRRALVDMMLTQIADISKADAFATLSGMSNFSEYVLYGVFCDHVVGLSGSGHYSTDRLLCATVWPGLDPSQLQQLLASLTIEDDQIAIGIQSTVPVAMADRRAMVKRLTDRG